MCASNEEPLHVRVGGARSKGHLLVVIFGNVKFLQAVWGGWDGSRDGLGTDTWSGDLTPTDRGRESRHV